MHLILRATIYRAPVRTLREYSTSFEAALSVCLADPKVKAVHKLRTDSRRLEAQIALLKAMGNLPPFRAEAAKALAQIKKVRQAAGRVRDMDVQSGHLRDYADKIRDGSQPEAEKEALLVELNAMLAKREGRRGEGASKLATEITARQQKVSAALEKLNSALKSALRKSIAGAELLGVTEKLFVRTPALKLSRPSEDDLHSVRKAAKQARYIAENAGAKIALAAARRYENLQELGGAWHDWLELTSAARKELGRKHVAVDQFRTLRNHNLKVYREELQNFVQPKTVKQKRAAARKKK